MSSIILLVDDNAIQAATRGAILERSGSRVIVAASGQAALNLLSSHDSHPDVGLIITDHLMPGMNGPELVSEIRRRGFEVPILVLSGLPDAETAYQGSNITFRLKPCPPDSLIALAQEMRGLRMPRTA